MSDYISKSAVIELIESKMTDGCLGTEDDTFVGGHGLVDEISDLSTLDEKEIIRKAFERVVERLEELEEENTADWQRFHCDDDFGRACAFEKAIKIVKEECGISE